MDDIDRKICDIVQANGRASSTELAERLGVSVSTANDRVRRLVASGAIAVWRGVLDPQRLGVTVCAFVLIDMSYDGEESATEALRKQPEVQELHHVSGARSYLAKVRVRDIEALQLFLQDVVKPLGAVQRTETLLALDTLKETSAIALEQ